MSLHSITDRFIEDIVKAARESFAQSPHRQPGEELYIQVSGSSGHKLANHAGLGALLGALPGLGTFAGGGSGNISGPAGMAIGAGLGADPGQNLSAAVGAGAGHMLGSSAGGIAGNLLHLNPNTISTLENILGTAGGVIGGHVRGKDDRGVIDRIKGASLNEICTKGVKAAAVRFGIKEAIFPGLAQKALAAMGQLGHGLQTGAQHIAPGLPEGLGRKVVSGIGQFGAGMHNAAPQILQGFKGAENKEAFIGPLLGSIAGPMLARAGVGALARGAGGAALGGMAGKVLPRIGGGIGGMAFDAASSMAGGALGDKLQQPRAPGL